MVAKGVLDGVHEYVGGLPWREFSEALMSACCLVSINPLRNTGRKFHEKFVTVRAAAL